MRVVFIVLCAFIYRINAHNQHGGGSDHVRPTGQPSHVNRKMEEYVHDMEYENIFFLFIKLFYC